MIQEILHILFVFNQVRFKEPEDNAVRKCWICDQYFWSYPDNQLLVCPDCKDAIHEHGYRKHIWYFSKRKNKVLKNFNGIANGFHR